MHNSTGIPQPGYVLLGGEGAAEGAVAGIENLDAEAGGFEDYDENQEEGTEDYEDEESLSFDIPIETPKQKVPMLLATSLVGAWILLLIAVGWTALKSGNRSTLSSINLDSDSLLTYRESFRESMEKVEEAWKATADTVKVAFAKYHLPTTHDGEQFSPSDAWKVLQRQIDGMNRTVSPQASATTEEKWRYAAQLQLVTCLCNSAALRLHGLSKLESKADKWGFQILSLGSGEAPQVQLPSDEEAAEGEEMTFAEFLKHLPSRSQQPLEAKEVEGTIPRSLGLRLAHLVEALDTYTLEGRYVAIRLDTFLQAYGAALETVKEQNFENAPPITSPVDKIPAEAKGLLHFIGDQFESSTQRLWAPVVAKACAEQWDEDTVTKLLQKVEKGEEERMRELLKTKRELVQQAAVEKPLPKGHIFALSVFML
ncbi:hypothetical protein, conserved [Eimeria praecox]|uniref:Uncharacterized protein n=1 Tax=Eimeria praecox TaxID=51316 RepID=U6G5F9_9EIME|nr:hypothetical protein, conserved [Eimeria praecox]